MTQRRKRGSKAAQDGHEPDDDGDGPVETGSFDENESHERHVQSLLSLVHAGGRVGIYRWKPTYAKGYLDVVTLDPDGDVGDFVQSIKDMWGGGRFSLRPINRGGEFSPGASPLEISGPALHEGRAYVNGKLPENEPAPAVPVMQPIQMAPPPAAANTDMTRLLGNMVESHATGRIDDLIKYNQQVFDLAQRAQAQTQPQAPAQSNPLGQIREGVAIVKEIANAGKALNGGAAPSESNESDDLLGGMSIEKMMMFGMAQKMGLIPQMGQGMPGMPPPGAQPYPQQPYPQQPYAQPQAPQQPYAQPQAPQQPAQPQPPIAQSKPAAPPSEPEPEWVTPDEVAERIEDLAKVDPAQAVQFVQSIMQRVPADVQAKMSGAPPGPRVVDKDPAAAEAAAFRTEYDVTAGA